MSRTVAGAAVALILSSCARIPAPPETVAPPGIRIDTIRHEDSLPPLTPPMALAPVVRWVPSTPQEGTMVSLMIEPRSSSVPVFEVQARSGDEVLNLTKLRDGDWLALVPATIGTREIPIEITVRFADGSRTRQTVTLWIESRQFASTRLSVARRYTAPDPATLERIRREQATVRAMLATVTDTPLWHGPFLKPVEGATTSPYGQRRMFNGELRSRHTGLDIDGDTGDPIYAANSGRVALSDDLFFNGGAVFIDHGLGFYTGYFHMSKREVSEGEWVDKGQLIGRVGATGRVTGPHLHWSLIVRGRSLDPLSLLEPEFGRLSERLPPPPVVAGRAENESAAAAGCDGRTCQ